jgi:hypothetical protein
VDADASIPANLTHPDAVNPAIRAVLEEIAL